MYTKCEAFLDGLANAVHDMDLESLQSRCALPFILVKEEPKSVITLKQELEEKLKGLLLAYNQLGVTNFTPKLKKAVPISEDMIYVTTEWSYCNSENEVVYSYENSYLLNEANGELKIVTLIVDDNEDLFLSLIN